LLLDAAQRRMLEVDRDLGPRFEAERGRAFVGPEAEERVRRYDVASSSASSCDPFQLAQLLERIDADIRVGADAEPDPALAELFDRREAVAEVGFGRQSEADPSAGIGDQIELMVVGMRGVDDRCARAEAPAIGE